MSFITDTFVGTAGTDLNTHTADVGGAWARQSGTSSGLILTNPNRIRPDVGTAVRVYYNATVPAAAEYDVSLDVTILSVIGDTAGPVGRASTGAATYYFARCNAQAGTVDLYKVVSGTPTLLASAAYTWTVGQTYTIKLELRDAAKKVHVNGVEVLSSADNAITAVGRAGVRFTGASGQSSAAGTHGSNFVAALPSTGATNTTPPTIAVQGGGQPVAGATLIANAGAWSGTTGGLTEVIQRNDSGVWTDVGYPYVITSGDAAAGKQFLVKETAANGPGPVYSSNTLTAVAPPVNTSAPTITTDGTPTVGETIQGAIGTWTGAVSYAWQWYRAGVAIAGASGTGSTVGDYTLVNADQGQDITLGVAATNTAGTTNATSTAITAGGVPAPINTVPPAITTDGTPATGETLTATTGTFTGEGGPFSYQRQWYRNGQAIGGATGGSYQLVVADEGTQITHGVRAVSTYGTSAEAVSDPVQPEVSAPLAANHIELRYSGGASNDDGTASLGGVMGGVYSGALGALFQTIPGSVAAAGGFLYRVIYVRNQHPTDTLADIKAFIEQQYAHPGLELAVGVPSQGVDTNVPALASQTTAPAGVPFVTTTDPDAGAAYGSLGPGQRRGLYLRLGVAAGTARISQAAGVFAVDGEAA
jgi:hypothetical protein